MAVAQQNLNEVMTDADLMDAIEALREKEPNGEVSELLKMMSENRMISWEEAEQILGSGTYSCPIKSSLPQQTRPTEPDNDTDVDLSILQIQTDDPKLKQVNLNNMKRTPIPQVKRLLSAIKDNTHLEKIALANMGLYDNDCEPIFEVIENNTTLKSINLETNYLSGDFFARLFKAALVNQTLEEVKAVNQGVTFATTAEREIIDSVFENRGLIKVSINLRLPEGRHKIENAMIRNQEIRRILRRQAAVAARAAEEAQKKPEQTSKQNAQIRKPLATKPAVLANGPQVPPTGKQPPSIVGNAGKAPPGIIGSAGKAPPAILGKAPPAVLGKSPPAVLRKAPPTVTGNETKQPPPLTNGTTTPTAKAPVKAEVPNTKAPIPAEQPAKTSELKKTRVKKAPTKTKTEDDTTTAALASAPTTATEKPKIKKTVPKKKISLEQAESEMELDTEEMQPKKTIAPKRSPLAAKKRTSVQAVNKSGAQESKDSSHPVRESSANTKLTKKDSVAPKNKNSAPPAHSNTSSVQSSVSEEQPVKSVNRSRNASLVPAIFLAADQTNGPVKRNFSIPSKKNSSDRETVAAKLGALKKSSMPSNPLSEPMQVYPLKRDSISKPS